MARGWPAQLGGADSGGRAAALTRESPTIYAPVVSSWKRRLFYVNPLSRMPATQTCNIRFQGV
eukprot:scaffold25636_cov57-Phaeocystis_antarctica.AAC.4